MDSFQVILETWLRNRWVSVAEKSGQKQKIKLKICQNLLLDFTLLFFIIDNTAHFKLHC